MTNNISVDQGDEFYPPVDLEGCELSEEYCPRCLHYGENVCMYFYPEGTSPDDFIIILVCPQCYYAERE